jgi:hypothetical protein
MSKTLTLSIKMLGKKHPVLESIAFQLSNQFPLSPTLQDLLIELVTQQVEQFNVSRTEENLLPYLSESDILDKAERGKVGFDAVYNDKTVLVEDALKTALQAFEDGLYFVFIDRVKIKNLEDKIELNENSELMLLRLTALVGGYF